MRLLLLLLFLQVVLKVRKRVTLMVITVSIIFGVCYLSDSTNFLLASYAPAHTVNDVAFLATTTMVLFNSAVNPIVYALVNFRFRGKIKAMVYRSEKSKAESKLSTETPSQHVKAARRDVCLMTNSNIDVDLPQVDSFTR